jgi:hypothetical protein
MRNVAKILVIAAGLLAAGSVAQAAPLGLVNNTPPDIKAPLVNVVYNATTKAFTANDTSASLFSVDTNGVAGAEYFVAGGTLSLTATIDNSGVLQPGGTFTLAGGSLLTSSFALVSAAPTLTGSLTNFGFPNVPGGNILEFTFNTTGGNLQSAPISFPGKGGIILAIPSAGFNGTFTSSFATTGAGTADIFGAPVPTPAAATGGVVGLVGLALRRRRGTSV